MKPHELAEKDYILGMAYKAIAAKYNVSLDTAKKWKTRYKWEREKPVKAVHTVHQNKKVDKSVQEPEEELTDKEQLFCYHYVRTWNATLAALKAGYSQNRACAQVTGSRVLNRERIQREIKRIKQLITEEIRVEAMDVLQQYIKIAFADVGDYVSFGQREVPVMGAFGPVLDPETKKPLKKVVNYVDAGESEQLDTSIIAKVKQGKDGFAIEFHDKMKALEKLEQYFDLLPDNFKRRIEEEKLDLERKKVEKAIKEPGAGNANVNININEPASVEARINELIAKRTTGT